MAAASIKDREEIIRQGSAIVGAILVQHEFQFLMIGSGSSSGGPFAHGEFVCGDRRLELHFRFSLGLVTYHLGKLSLGHEDYMRALFGRSGAGHYPQPPGADPLAAFECLRRDLAEHCSDFVFGSGDQFRACVEKHRLYETLSPFQKMEYGSL